jgi:hypothetical protein
MISTRGLPMLFSLASGGGEQARTRGRLNASKALISNLSLELAGYYHNKREMMNAEMLNAE